MCNCAQCQAQRYEQNMEVPPIRKTQKPNNRRFQIQAQGQIKNPNINGQFNFQTNGGGVPPPTPDTGGLDIRGRICITIDQFDHNRTVIPHKSIPLLRKVLKTIFCMSEDIDYVKLIGHADESGPDEYNVGLGLRRAKSVQKFLVDGLKRLRWLEKDILTRIKFDINTKGETEPVGPTHAKDRRVQIEIAYRPAPQSKLPHCESLVMPPPPIPMPVIQPQPKPPVRPIPYPNNQSFINGHLGFNLHGNRPNRPRWDLDVDISGQGVFKNNFGKNLQKGASFLNQLVNESEME